MKRKAQILTILCLACVTLVFLSRPTAAEISSPGSDSKQESGEWSEVVDQIRGRLVADTILDAQGLDVVRIHLELQNLAVTPRSGKKFVSRAHRASIGS